MVIIHRLIRVLPAFAPLTVQEDQIALIVVFRVGRHLQGTIKRIIVPALLLGMLFKLMVVVFAAELLMPAVYVMVAALEVGFTMVTVLRKLSLAIAELLVKQIKILPMDAPILAVLAELVPVGLTANASRIPAHKKPIFFFDPSENYFCR